MVSPDKCVHMPLILTHLSMLLHTQVGLLCMALVHKSRWYKPTIVVKNINPFSIHPTLSR